MIAERMPGVDPPFAFGLGRSMRMPRWITCGSANTSGIVLIGPAGTRSYAELCEEAKRIPERLRAIATVDGCDTFDPERLIAVAESVFGIEVKGQDRQARLARVLDGRYWRKVLWKRVGQEKELLLVIGRDALEELVAA